MIFFELVRVISWKPSVIFFGKQNIETKHLKQKHFPKQKHLLTFYNFLLKKGFNKVLRVLSMFYTHLAAPSSGYDFHDTKGRQLEVRAQRAPRLLI